MSPALIVQDSIFRAPRWTRMLTESVDDFVLVRFPDNLEEMIRCATHFDQSIAIAERTLLETAAAPKSLRCIARLDGTEPAETLERLLLLGCYGFVRDGISAASLRRVLRGVGAGEMVAGRKLLSSCFQRLLAGAAAPKLSRREHQVLGLLGQRLSNKLIAEKLFISEETLRWHLRNLYSKTELQSRRDLVEYASTISGAPDPAVKIVAAG